MMCGIWKSKSRKELEPSQYSKLSRSITTINISGGEPFLRRDLVEVIKTIHSVVPNARLVFSTNGLLTEEIVARLEEIRSIHKKIGIGVSIDGLEEVHDRIRGTPGAFIKATETVKRLKEHGFKDLRIAMTVFDENADQVWNVFNLSKQLGVEFTATLAHNSEFYFQKDDNISPKLLESGVKDMPRVMRSQLRSKSVKDWYRAYHTMGMISSDHRSKFVSRCEAGRRYFFMSPDGDVYPCNVLNWKIGNLSEVKTWDDLFPVEVEKKVRKMVTDCRNDCWMVCNTRSLVVAHPFGVSAWVLRSKIRAHLESER